MKRAAPSRSQSRLGNAISYVLIIGVMASLLLELTGIVLFRHAHGQLAISQDPSVFIRGRDFFSFILDQFQGNRSGDSAVLFMVAGVVVLMLTPYVRVIMSVLYFAWEKNAKYVLITLFVLAVLTVSLVLH